MGIFSSYGPAFDLPDPPCNICGKSPDDCICPTCLTCGEVGDPACYREHGLTRSPEQVASRAEAETVWDAEAERQVAWETR